MNKYFSVINNPNNFFLHLIFLLPLIGTSIPAYIIAIVYLLINVTKLKFKLEDLVFLGVILTWFIFKIQQSNLVACTILFRYYFGFYVFYLFFNKSKIQIKLDKLLWIICIAVVIEAIIINTIVPAQYLPNYPKTELGDLTAETKILGFYQRPYSIGTNSTITSTLVMVLIFYVFGFSKALDINRSNKLLFFSFFTVLILGSGTGYALLLLFLIYKTRPFKNIVTASFSILFIMLIYYLIFVLDIGSLDGLDKISALYLNFLYDFKILQIQDVNYLLNTEQFQTIIGRSFQDPKELIIWSDFAWLNLFECTGYLGLLTTILIFLFKTNRYNYITVLVFIIGAFHYGAIYALPGQLLIGYFLSINFITNEKVSKNILNV